MARIHPVTAADAPAASAPLLAAINAKFGFVPQMMGTIAHAPAVLRGYVGFAEALAGGGLSTRERELLALAVGEANQCDYCLAAHATLGKGVGLGDSDIAAARQGEAADARENALLQFARSVVHERGRVDDTTIASARNRGLDDALLLEVVANVALNVFTNTINHVAQTELDFPAVPRLAA